MDYCKTPIVCVLKLRNNCKIMTVAELIEILKELPQDYTVTASTQDGGEVTEVYEYSYILREVELS